MVSDIINTLMIPAYLTTVYKAVTDIWNAFPAVVKIAFLCCFGAACLFAILKMLF